MNLFSRGTAFSGPYYRFGSATSSFYMDDVKCTGYESSILSCRYSGWGNHNCGSGEAAKVECGGKIYHYHRTVSEVLMNNLISLRLNFATR